jgi:dTDP-4-dehydrorhamnose reductase
VSLTAIGKRGVYNAATSKRISKYEFGRALARRFDLNVDLIIPDKIQNRENLVNRPLDMSLDNQKLSLALGGSKIILDKEMERLFYDEHSAWFREVKVK